MPTYSKQDPASIRTLFTSIARRYDIGNAVLSMQLFRRWNQQLIDSVVKPTKPKLMLDLCCGTGDIAFSYLSQTQTPPDTTFMIDFCHEMLKHAKIKAEALPKGKSNIHYITGDAQDIPLPDACVDCITIAYGIRNVAIPDKCIEEAFRVLRPGGCLGILELTRPKSAFMRAGHAIYLRTIVPIVGRFLTSNRQAYDYLQKSIRHFISPDDLRHMMLNAGFSDVIITPLSGGIATIISGQKN